MRIDSLLATGGPVFSFEFFPPRTDEAHQQLVATVVELARLEPAFVSVTYGAGGSTRSRTMETAAWIRQAGIEPLVHLTCSGHTREEMQDLITQLQGLGIHNLLCLRGDPPSNGSGEPSHLPKGDFRYASELIKLAGTVSDGGCCLAGACYPEQHPESLSLEADTLATLAKVEAGARFLITQLFFSNEDYFRCVERLRQAGVRVPIIPGIMPITNLAQVKRFTQVCGAKIPPRLLGELDRFAAEPETVMEIGIAHATAQCAELLQRGAPGIHFFTLNRSRATRAILTALRCH